LSRGGSVIELHRRVAQVTLAHSVVAVEHGTRLVAAEPNHSDHAESLV